MLAVAPSPLFLSLADMLDSGLLLLGADRTVLFLNGRASEIFDTTAAVAVGRGLISVLRDYQADQMVQDVLTDNEPREAIIQMPSSGRTLRLRCAPTSAAPTDHADVRLILLVQDQTQLSQLERARRDLVANVSHELRTPLASLKLLAETLQSDPPEPIARRMLHQMTNEIDAVTHLVEELHELSQLEAGRITIQLTPGRIGQVIERALARIRPQADRKQIMIIANVVDHRMPVLIDSRRIDQILLNLLHNAVKFTPEHGRITVQTWVIHVDEHDRTQYRLHTGPTGPTLASSDAPAPLLATPTGTQTTLPDDHPAGMWLLISISDTGIGIPADQLPRVFERFFKVDRSRTRNVGGTGLGLAIAKHLVEGHGGRLWADSSERRGSTFHFTVPMA